MRPVPFWWRMGVRIRRRATALDFAVVAWVMVWLISKVA